MDEASQPANVRYTDDGRSFIKTLRLIAVSALSLSLLSVAVGHLFSSGSYFEDGFYFIYDGLIYGLAAISYGRSVVFERMTAFMLSGLFAVAGCQGSYDLWNEIARNATDHQDHAPAAAITFAIVAILEAALLFRFRASGDPLMEATWISTRNYAVIALAGAIVPILWRASSGGPEIFVGGIDTVISFQAAIFVARATLRINGDSDPGI